MKCQFSGFSVKRLLQDTVNISVSYEHVLSFLLFFFFCIREILQRNLFKHKSFPDIFVNKLQRHIIKIESSTLQ